MQESLADQLRRYAEAQGIQINVEAPKKALSDRFEQLGRGWVNRRIYRFVAGISIDALRVEWGELENELSSADSSDERLQFLTKTATGMRLIVRNLDKDQVRYGAKVLHPDFHDPASPLIWEITQGIDISVSSIIVLKALDDLWNNPARSDELRDYMIDSTHRVDLANGRNGSIQIGGLLVTLGAYYDYRSNFRMS